MLIDDIHWADVASLDLLLHLARHTGGDRILLLVTYRDIEVNRQHPLEAALRDLQREDLVERIVVRRLEQTQTAALMAMSMGEEGVSEEFASLIFERTEGNPFFVQQVMRMLVERGDIYRNGHHWERKAVGEIDVPESIRSVVGQRLSRLGGETQETLREASVLGQTFIFEDLETMTKRSERDVEDALEEAARAGLMREVARDQYAFDHALTQQSLYAELPTRRRRRLHLAAGAALEKKSEQKLQNRAAELAWHFLEGDVPERALHWAIVAGDAAEAVFAHSDAELHYRTALQLARELADQSREVEALEKLSNALFMLARYGEMLDMLLPALQIYRETDDTEGEMRIAAAIGWAYVETAKRGEGIETLTPVLEHWRASGRRSSPAAAAMHVALGNLYCSAGRFEDSLSLLMVGSELAETIGDTRLLGVIEGRRAMPLMYLGRIDEALVAEDRAIAIAAAVDDLDTLGRALNNRALLHGAYRNHWTLAKADMEQHIEVARKLGAPDQLAWALGSLGYEYWIEGHSARALELLDESARIAGRLGPSRSSTWMPLAAYTRMLMGDVPTATRGLDEFVRSGKLQNDTMLLSTSAAYLAEWHLIQDRPKDARALIESVIDHPNFEEVIREELRQLLALALVHTGDVDGAEELVKEGLPHARASGSPPAIAAWCRAQGVVRAQQHRWNEARGAFEEALLMHRSRGHIVREAQVLHDLGRMEARRGDQNTARECFEQELAILRRIGAPPLIETAERALAQSQNSRSVQSPI